MDSAGRGVLLFVLSFDVLPANWNFTGDRPGSRQVNTTLSIVLSRKVDCGVG